MTRLEAEHFGPTGKPKRAFDYEYVIRARVEVGVGLGRRVIMAEHRFTEDDLRRLSEAMTPTEVRDLDQHIIANLRRKLIDQAAEEGWDIDNSDIAVSSTSEMRMSWSDVAAATNRAVRLYNEGETR